MLNMSVGANFRCISYDGWCDKLTDEQLEEFEQEGADLLSKYEDYIAMLQDLAYDTYKDDKLMGDINEKDI